MKLDRGHEDIMVLLAYEIHPLHKKEMCDAPSKTVNVIDPSESIIVRLSHQVRTYTAIC